MWPLASPTIQRGAEEKQRTEHKITNLLKPSLLHSTIKRTKDAAQKVKSMILKAELDQSKIS